MPRDSLPYVKLNLNTIMESIKIQHSDLWDTALDAGKTAVGSKTAVTATKRYKADNGKWRYTIIVDGVTYDDVSLDRIRTIANGESGKSGGNGGNGRRKRTLTLPVTFEEYLDLRIKKIEQNADAMIALAVNDEMKTLLLGQKAIMVQTESDKATKDWAERQKNIEAYNDYQAKYDAEEKRIIKLIRAGEYDSIKFDDIKTLRANMEKEKAKL